MGHRRCDDSNTIPFNLCRHLNPPFRRLTTAAQTPHALIFGRANMSKAGLEAAMAGVRSVQISNGLAIDVATNL